MYLSPMPKVEWFRTRFWAVQFIREFKSSCTSLTSRLSLCGWKLIIRSAGYFTWIYVPLSFLLITVIHLSQTSLQLDTSGKAIAAVYLQSITTDHLAFHLASVYYLMFSYPSSISDHKLLILQHISFVSSKQIFFWTWKAHISMPYFCTPNCMQGQLFNAVPDRWFPHNPLSPTAGNMTVGGIATHGVTEHFLKFKLQHLTLRSKDHYKWGQTVAYIGLYLLIFERVWTLGLGPSGKKPSSEIFSSHKLFGIIHGSFREKNKTLEDVVLESPANHIVWLFSVPARKKKLDTMVS